MSLNVEHLKVAELEDKCHEETREYLKNKKNFTDYYCLELFKRAIEDNCNLSFKAIYNNYRVLVHSWVRKHNVYRELPIEEDELVFDCISQFFFAMKRISIHNFDSIGKILAYWKKCVHTVLTTEWRRQNRSGIPVSEQIIGQEDSKQGFELNLESAWQRIEQLLPSEKDKLLARLIFTQNLKPRHIIEEYPQKWKTADDVRINRQKIIRRLRNDRLLKNLLTGDS